MPSRAARTAGLLAFELFVIDVVLLLVLIRARYFNLLDLATAWKTGKDAWVAVAGAVTIVLGGILYLWKGESEVTLPLVVKAIALRRGKEPSRTRIIVYTVVGVALALWLASTPSAIELRQVEAALPALSSDFRPLYTSEGEAETTHHEVVLFTGPYNIPSDYTIRVSLRAYGQLTFRTVHIDSRFNYVKPLQTTDIQTDENTATKSFAFPVQKEELIGTRIIRFNIGRGTGVDVDAAASTIVDVAVQSGNQTLAWVRTPVALRWHPNR